MIVYNGQISRGAGFCMNPECTEFQKDVFLMAHNGSFKCGRCHRIGRKVMEYGETDNESLPFWSVRVEFCYDVTFDTYRSVAVVTDEDMSKEGNIYTLYTPLVKTEKRALLMAEAILGTLMRADESIFAKGYIPKDQIYSIDLDKPFIEVQQRLKEVEAIVSNSWLSRTKTAV